ncbi:ABC transporter permease [Rhodococcus sp. 06-156-3C]|uniref:ABC transporter permease n=1 Tax=Nocardiaceae TaxID=85025 RepID=UPI00068B6EC6|nr:MULTISPECIES: ABC transporter permease [Rhodococcus]OZD18215.1 ABC transporter permease [Rhodococcus sp. 06-156-4C]OZD18812.1 ABC transporter permease [Rhodococcus sp. 06-156-3C]OZD22322.1 ABC transporter permease [Rhodococcus sp. 06-156-4a]OZD34128.1 ABC transporter permease [Rhodococcus sp. 06-156-3b]OZD38865.1 ABC transporter permease [Rhodococcus sp. 06-156-3]
MKSVRAHTLYWHARTLIAWSLAAVAFAYFATTDANFLNQGNLYALMQILSTLVVVATGLAVVMVVAEFDLSIAGTFPLAGLVAVKVGSEFGAIVGICAAVVTGVALGMLNGYLTSRFRISSLAVTVATMVLSIGIGYWITGSQLVKLSDYDASLVLAQRILGIFSLQSLIQIALAVAALAYVTYSWRGRYLYATGSDAARARASGLPVNATVIAAFSIAGACAAISGALQGITLASAQAGSNDAFLLQCATAALIGGIALTGGRGSLIGVFGGAALLAVLSNGLGLAGVDSAVIQLINGTVLLVVVLIDKPINRLVERRMQSGHRIDQLPRQSSFDVSKETV